MDPFNNLWNSILIYFPFAVLGTSLLGSGHCVAMCGGLMISVSRNRNAAIFYHLGRLIGYSFLGASAGFLGHQIFNSISLSFFPEFAAGLIASSFIYMGVQLWLGKSPHLFRLPNSFLNRLHNLGGHGAFSVGLLSAVLPCGWLHTFVLGAISMHEPLKGAIYLFLFWLGTLPALSMTNFTATRIFRPFSRYTPKVSGLILISMGLLSLGMKMIPSHKQTTCHSPSNHLHP